MFSERAHLEIGCENIQKRSLKVTNKDAKEGYGFFTMNSGQIVRTLNKQFWNEENFDKVSGRWFQVVKLQKN